ncbi:carbohydrate porin [Desulfopila sp. IMCC35008]|uniref:carbohydrate porin n=1 Tax=Desulfopila sp. IMCC35008 TaxID=2653858 RepID=UPI0013D306CC|nr:carbohydrate porin [Desulfopila sp. IMCC35008]
MKIFRCLCRVIVIVSFCSITFEAGAGELYSSQDYIAGDWGGYRTKLHDAGVQVGLSYTAEPAVLIAGGYEYEDTYLHNINIEVRLDLQNLIHVPNTTFLAKYSSRSGDNLSEEYVVPGLAEDGRYVYGEYFNKSQEAFGGQTTKLVNFQLTTTLGDNWSIDYGRLVMNDLFLRSDLYCNFMNNAICGSPKGVFTPYALNAYPDATAGIHTAIKAGDMVELRLGVFDGGWMEQESNGWDWSLGENGAAVAGELQLYFDRAAAGGAQKVIKLGASHHTGDFANMKTGEVTDGQNSVWLLADWMLFREEGSMTQGLAVFGSIVANSDDEISALPMTYTLGFMYEGLIPSRDRDRLGMMITYAEHSEYNTYTHDFVSGKEREAETILEITYNLVLGYGVQLMPSMQFITNPNGSEDFSDVTVFGLKFNVNL